MDTYQKEKQRQEEAYQEIERKSLGEEAILTFFRVHAGEINPCEASRQACIRYFSGDEITVEALEDSWVNHPNFKRLLALDTEQDERVRVESRILELMRIGHSPNVIADAQAKFRFKAYGKYVQSIEELRNKRDELERVAELRGKTPEELRVIVRSGDATQPELPSEISGLQIRKLLDATQLRHLISKYGAAAVSKRANEGRD